MVHISFKTKKSMIGLLLAVFVLGICMYTGSSTQVGVLLAVVLVVEGLITIKFSGLINELFLILYCLGGMVGALFVQQFVQNETMFSLPCLQMALGICCVGVFFLLGMILSGSSRFSFCGMYIVVLIFSTINDAIYQFRGTELTPADVLSLETALNVAGEYHYQVGNYVIYGWLISIVICVGIFCLEVDRNEKDLKRRLISIAALFVCVGSILAGEQKIHTAHFLKTGTVENGFLLNFVYQIGETFVQKPKSYNSELIQSYLPEESSTFQEHELDPDIIVIMNESFADLSVLGNELHTDIPIMPYYDSLTENTIKGYALSSVFGGGTPNSEYEFLTGNSLAFLPEGAIVYQQFLKEDNYSILSHLESRNYETFATHPYLANGWLRDSKWATLGFDAYTFVDDYQQEDMIRELVSDEELYGYIIDHYEQNVGDKQFIFGVSMQNHGAYDYENPRFAEEVHLVGYEGSYPDVEQYLSLVHASDAALKKLIAYFSEIDRPVVILFYGNHLPSLNQNFYREVHGGGFEELDEVKSMYSIPFTVWTNYDIQEKTVKLTSINYLSNYVFEAAGLPLPPYNKILQKIEEEIPAINALGYYSKVDNCFKRMEQAKGVEADALLKYNCLEYNCMFESNRNTYIFPLQN